MSIGMSFIVITVSDLSIFSLLSSDETSIVADFGNVKLGALWATLPTQFAL